MFRPFITSVAAASAAIALSASAQTASNRVAPAPDDMDLLRAVEANFPDDYARGSRSQLDALGFVFDPQLTVVRAGRIRKQIGYPVVTSMEEQLALPLRTGMSSAGSVCFDSVPQRHGRFCVEWVVLR